MTSQWGVLLAAMLANNLLLTQMLGVCPLLGAARKLEVALLVAAATSLITVLAASIGYFLYSGLLVHLEGRFWRLPVFLPLVLVLSLGVDFAARRLFPLLHRVTGLLLPLAGMNCLVLAVLLSHRPQNFLAALFAACGAAAGFSLVLLLFTALQGRLLPQAAPAAWRGAPLALFSMGLVALGLSGFAPPG